MQERRNLQTLTQAIGSQLINIYKLRDEIQEEKDKPKFNKQKIKYLDRLCTKFNASFHEVVRNTPIAKTEYFTCNPETIFKNLKKTPFKEFIKPYIGDITSPHKMMFNKDLVLGLKLNLELLQIHYRFDCDDPGNKGLHFNMYFIINGKTYPFAISRFIPDAGRFYVKPQLLESQRNDLIKYKFFIKMTASCVINNLHPTLKNENQFIEFFVNNVNDIDSLENAFEEKMDRDNTINSLIFAYTAHRKANKVTSVDTNTEDSETINISEKSPIV